MDDDSSNIRKAKTLKACQTMEIKPRNGMTSNHMDEIEKIIGVFEIEKKQEQNKNNTDNENSDENSKDDKNDKNSNNSSNNDNSSNKNGNDNNSNSNNNDSNNNNSNNNNNNNSNNNSNDENNNGNSNTNNSNTDDSKEPATNRQSSLKQKYAINADNSKLLDKLIADGNEDSETPVVDISHQSDSETNDNGDDIVLSAPVFGVPQQKE